MSEDPPDRDVERLLRLSEEVTRIAGSLAQLSMGVRGPLGQHLPATNSNQSEISEATVGWLIRARRSRGRYLPPDLFAEPAWDILLDLLHAELAGRRVSVASACAASGVPPTTGLRWVGVLEQQGLVLQQTDPDDPAATLVELSPSGSKALRHYFADQVEGQCAQEQ